MDESTGKCTQQSYSFSGNLSPLDEELSVHFRGPLTLLQFGVYYPSSSGNSKRQIDDQDCNVKHVHHKHKRATEVVQVTQTVLLMEMVTLLLPKLSKLLLSNPVLLFHLLLLTIMPTLTLDLALALAPVMDQYLPLTVKVKLTDPISQLNLLQPVLLLNHLHQKPPLSMVLGPETVIILQDPPITVCS